jgi:hypothetical protein
MPEVEKERKVREIMRKQGWPQFSSAQKSSPVGECFFASTLLDENKHQNNVTKQMPMGRLLTKRSRK